jgi:hypothetical protein
MKSMLRWVNIGLLAGFVALIWSCSSHDSQPATVEVRLTDAPGDFEEVNIDIQDVQVNADSSSSGGWMSLDVKNKGVYNLLKLTNGLDTLLGDIQLPEGKISQIRLILGTNNSVKAGGVSTVLKTPSAQQSGLKIQVHTSLKAGVNYIITLDFDAARSIVTAGNGSFNLKPVIRSVVAESGAIKGTVSPAAATPAVFVIRGTGTGADTVAAAYADQLTGKFLLNGIAAGTYTVSFAPKSGYMARDSSGVKVTLGSVTDLGTIEIKQ